jgi:hypothetical protein
MCHQRDIPTILKPIIESCILFALRCVVVSATASHTEAKLCNQYTDDNHSDGSTGYDSNCNRAEIV